MTRRRKFWSQATLDFPAAAEAAQPLLRRRLARDAQSRSACRPIAAVHDRLRRVVGLGRCFIGYGGRTFEMLKFRSMYVDAERQTGPVWASRNDRRCTPLGRVLRRWSLDELPQLVNVLAGDMSLVGPRPERGALVEKFRDQIPNYLQRQQVKAGITGWAQVHGWRGNTSLRRRLECDLYYISNWSLCSTARFSA